MTSSIATVFKLSILIVLLHTITHTYNKSIFKSKMKVKTRKNCTYPMHLVGTVAVFDDFKEMPSSVKFITGMEKHEQLELSSVDIWLWYRKP